METELQLALSEIARLKSENNTLRNNYSVLEHKHKALQQRHGELKLKCDDQDQENEFLYNTMRDNEEEVKRQEKIIEAMEEEIETLQNDNEVITAHKWAVVYDELEYEHIKSQNGAALDFIEKKDLTKEFEKEHGHVEEVATQLDNLRLGSEMEGDCTGDIEMGEIAAKVDEVEICPHWARRGACRLAGPGLKCKLGWHISAVAAKEHLKSRDLVG
jgi:chromosome segregation ATPase